MEIDHIFIFSDNKGKEAYDLMSFGFTEGSNRIHPGQGTTNRKFYFENFFLEILWVINEEEIQSKTTSITKLWERSQFLKNEYSPFGLSLVNTKATDKLFKKSKTYQPNYFPKGMSIDIITNDHHPTLPWTFRLPYKGERKSHNEPIKHANGISKLTQVRFEIKTNDTNNNFLNFFKEIDNVVFEHSDRTHLTLVFDHRIQGNKKEFSELNLTIEY